MLFDLALQAYEDDKIVSRKARALKLQNLLKKDLNLDITPTSGIYKFVEQDMPYYIVILPAYLNIFLFLCKYTDGNWYKSESSLFSLVYLGKMLKEGIVWNSFKPFETFLEDLNYSYPEWEKCGAY